jgi:hypothetical protein
MSLDRTRSIERTVQFKSNLSTRYYNFSFVRKGWVTSALLSLIFLEEIAPLPRG